MHHTDLAENETYYGINPVQFGYETCKKSHFFGPAVRTHWLIHFVVSGCGIYKIGDRNYRVKAGEMFVIPPYEETYYEADAVTPWSYIWIGFTANGALPKELSDVISCPEAEHIFLSVKRCRERNGGRNAYLTARIWDLFSLLQEENVGYDYVTKAVEYIHSEYMYDLTVEKIARRLSVDRTCLSAAFKKKTGVSPKQYLIQYRMNVAASLLEKGNISVSVAAYSVGYADIFNFSKMFKKHFGISPKQYALRAQGRTVR